VIEKILSLIPSGINRLVSRSMYHATARNLSAMSIHTNVPRGQFTLCRNLNHPYAVYRFLSTFVSVGTLTVDEHQVARPQYVFGITSSSDVPCLFIYSGMGQLRILRILNVRNELKYVASPIPEFAYQFPCLEELHLGQCNNLASFGLVSNAMSNLRTLELRGISLELDVSSLIGLSSLTKLAMSPHPILGERGCLCADPGDVLWHVTCVNGSHRYRRAMTISNIASLSRLTSLQWLELIRCDTVDLDFLNGLDELRTLLMPFAYELFDISGLSHCPQLTRLDLGDPEMEFEADDFLNLNGTCDVLREHCFRREPMPIRHIRLTADWMDLLRLTVDMHCVDNPAPSMVLAGCRLTIEPEDEDSLTAEDWNTAAQSDGSREHHYHVPCEGMWQMIAKFNS
jgi:hypothetical protein